MAAARLEEILAWVGSSTLERLISREATHIVGHVFLYGTLAAVCRALVRRTWLVYAIVLAIAVVQECAQVRSNHRAPSWPELFDLGVDTVAVAVVLAVAALRGRRSDEPARSE